MSKTVSIKDNKEDKVKDILEEKGASDVRVISVSE